MSKITAVLGSALFFVVAPAMLVGVIPWLITDWEFRPPFLDARATRVAGLAFIIAGVSGLLDSFAPSFLVRRCYSLTGISSATAPCSGSFFTLG